MLRHIPTVLHSPSIYMCIYMCVYIYNVAPEDGLESPKHVEHPKIKIS